MGQPFNIMMALGPVATLQATAGHGTRQMFHWWWLKD
jgi:hypothetical protein